MSAAGKDVDASSYTTPLSTLVENGLCSCVEELSRVFSADIFIERASRVKYTFPPGEKRGMWSSGRILFATKTMRLTESMHFISDDCHEKNRSIDRKRPAWPDKKRAESESGLIFLRPRRASASDKPSVSDIGVLELSRVPVASESASAVKIMRARKQ